MTGSSEKKNPKETPEGILRRLSPIRDRKMKLLLLRKIILGIDSRRLAEIIHEILDRSARGEQGFKDVVLLLVENLKRNALGYERLCGIYEHSAERDWEDVKTLLRSAPAMKEARPEDKIHPDVDLGRKSLGERKWMARSLDRNLLDRLLYDPDPAVICNLLQNPRITESDVVKAAARRPNSSVVLEEIFGSQKWISSYRIKRVLVLNPYTPTDISLKLVALLLKADLELVSNDTSLHPLVREAASRRLGTEPDEPGGEQRNRPGPRKSKRKKTAAFSREEAQGEGRKLPTRII